MTVAIQVDKTSGLNGQQMKDHSIVLKQKQYNSISTTTTSLLLYSLNSPTQLSNIYLYCPPLLPPPLSSISPSLNYFYCSSLPLPLSPLVHQTLFITSWHHQGVSTISNSTFLLSTITPILNKEYQVLHSSNIQLIIYQSVQCNGDCQPIEYLTMYSFSIEICCSPIYNILSRMCLTYYIPYRLVVST